MEEASGELPAGCKAREVLITCPLAGRCASAGVLLEGVPLAGVPVVGVWQFGQCECNHCGLKFFNYE